jgi:hypothetical protein
VPENEYRTPKRSPPGAATEAESAMNRDEIPRLQQQRRMPFNCDLIV